MDDEQFKKLPLDSSNPEFSPANNQALPNLTTSIQYDETSYVTNPNLTQSAMPPQINATVLQLSDVDLNPNAETDEETPTQNKVITANANQASLKPSSQNEFGQNAFKNPEADVNEKRDEDEDDCNF